MMMTRCPRTETTMARESALSSRLQRIRHFATILWFWFACVLNVLCFVVFLIGFQCLLSADEARWNDLDVHSTSGDSGCVEMKPATAESAHAADSTDIAECAQDSAESTDICVDITSAPGNVGNLVKKFEVIEKTGIGAETGKPLKSSAAVRYYDHGLDGSHKTSCVHQPSAGVVKKLVKRFDGSEKIPVLDDKPSQQVYKTSTVINLIRRFNYSATV